MSSNFRAYRDNAALAVSVGGQITDTEMALHLHPDRLGEEVRFRVALAITALVMEKLGPAIGKALSEVAPPAPEGER